MKIDLGSLLCLFLLFYILLYSLLLYYYTINDIMKILHTAGVVYNRKKKYFDRKNHCTGSKLPANHGS